MGDHPRHRRTDLPGVEIDAPANRIHHCVEIGICNDDGGGLAAELEDCRLHIRRRRGGNANAGFHRFGEDDIADVWMRRQCRSGLVTKPAQDVQRAFRQADGLGRPRQPDVAERVQLGRFHHTGIGRGQRRRDAARGHFQRLVPGNDLGRNTERLVDGEIEIVATKRNRTPFDGFRLIAVIFEIACRAFSLDQGFPIGLA